MNLIGIAAILSVIGWFCISLIGIYLFVRASKKMNEDFDNLWKDM